MDIWVNVGISSSARPDVLFAAFLTVPGAFLSVRLIKKPLLPALICI